MASKCTKCGNTENYNFALNIGLCDPCIGERIEELEADIKIKQSVCETIEKEVAEINEKLREQIKDLEDDKENLRQYASGLENAQNLITVRYKDLETLLEQLIPIAEKADTDDSEDTTIELVKQALTRS